MHQVIMAVVLIKDNRALSHHPSAWRSRSAHIVMPRHCAGSCCKLLCNVLSQIKCVELWNQDAAHES